MTTVTMKTFQPKNYQEAARLFVLPLIAFVLFLGMWSYAAARIETSLGQLPGPIAVWGQAANLVVEHRAERQKELAFFERQEKRNEAKLAEDPAASVRIRPYTGKPTFFDQILTSLLTVFTGFLLATVIAVPLGVLTGLSSNVYRAINPLVQIFKPVSPLAWLPIVTIIVSAVYVTDEPMFSKSYLTSAITVTLCCLWPTLINTAVGVSSVDRELMNVGKVLRLGWFTTVWKIALPSAIPMIFTGMRLSLSIGWMVLIGA